MSFKVKAPGTLMILGEYAVLQGKLAIVCSIDKFIHVTIKSRFDNNIYIDSDLGQHETTTTELRSIAPFEYVLTALMLSQPLPGGCDIIIESEFSSKIGLGSSAAVTVAMVNALHLWLKQTPIVPEHTWQQAKRIVHRVKGKGSGADLAASIYGGIIAFQNEPFHVERLSDTLPLCVVYSGKKTPTHQAIDIIQARRKKLPAFFQHWDDSMHVLTTEAVDAIKAQDWKRLGSLFEKAQSLMMAIGVSNSRLNEIVRTLQKQPGILGAKISGSGFGDCAIGLGELSTTVFPSNDSQKQQGVHQISATISREGAFVNDY